MHPGARNFIEKTIKRHGIRSPVCEFGSLLTPGQEEIADLRPLFEGHPYIGCDIREGKGVDTVTNISNTKFWGGSFGTVIAADTLEHVANFWMAMWEMHRILRKGGLLIITSVFFFPIHNYPHDYWRFTPQAFTFLLKLFKESEVEYDGNEKIPAAVYGWGIK